MASARDYLHGNRPYRRYLDDPEYTHDDGQPQVPFWQKALIGAGALFLGGPALRRGYESGAFRELLEPMIESMASYEGSRVGSILQGLRTWASDPALAQRANWFGEMYHTHSPVGLLSNLAENASFHLGGLRREIRDELSDTARRVQRSEMTEFERAVTERARVFSRMKEATDGGRANFQKGAYDEVHDAWLNEMRERFGVTAQQRETMLQAQGSRHMTVGEAMERGVMRGLVNPPPDSAQERTRDFVQQLLQSVPDIADLAADTNLLVNEAGSTLDLRRFNRAWRDVGLSAARDFKLPFVGFNPLRMWFVDHMIEADNRPFAHLFDDMGFQPGISLDNQRLNRHVVYLNGKLHQIHSNNIEKIGEGFTLTRARYDGWTGQNATAASIFGQLAGIEVADKRDKKGFLYEWIMKPLDIGYQDVQTHFDPFSPDQWPSHLADRAMNHIRPYTAADARPLRHAFGVNESWVAIRPFLNLEEAGSAQKFMGQFVAGRENLQDVTMATLFPMGYVMRMNNLLNQMGMGLSARSMGSVTELTGNLITKRVLPIAAGAFAWKYGSFAFRGAVGASPAQGVANIIAGTNLGLANIRDTYGITNLMKGLGAVMPGIDNLTQIPVLPLPDDNADVHLLTIGDLMPWDKTREELQDHYEWGSDPVRKSRYWSLGNTPFTGGKIDHFEPNWYRQIQSQWQFTDTMWGSQDEYFANAPFPTPAHPLAPIRHFLTDPYHYERKHYRDRPYPVTGGFSEFQELPFVGPAVSATLGNLLKPTTTMHQDEQFGAGAVPGAATGPAPLILPAAPNMSGGMGGGGGTGGGGGGGAAAGTGGGAAAGTGNELTQNLQTVAYVTASGQVQVMRMREQMSVGLVNASLATGSGQRSGFLMPLRKGGVGGPAPAADPFAANVQLAQWGTDMAEIGGFYGFTFKQMLSDGGQASAPRLATSRGLTSYRAQWGDQQIGGFLGEGNELMRRILPQEKFKDDVNPIRNTQPYWVPGSSYFTNFQTGDPYAKVARGAIRLPGAAYEKMWGIEDPTKLRVSASALGKEPQEQIDYWLHLKDIASDDTEDILKSGESQHRKIQAMLNNRGSLIDKERYVSDEKMGVGGFYDARIHDKTAPMGQAIVEIKTMNQRKWDENKPFDPHIDQLNFYLHASGLDRGYLYYVNRDKPDEDPRLYTFSYSPERMRATTARLESTRAKVRGMIDQGVLNPGDFYKPLDRLRVLGDVAPWSQEYKDINTMVSKMAEQGLVDDAEMKKVRSIRDQARQMKQPLRLYPYKFKTAELDYETVTVSKVIDNNTFLTEQYPDKPIRLAGIRVPTGKDDPRAQQARDMIATHVSPGKDVTIGVAADGAIRQADDTYGTIRAIIDTRHGENLNRQLLKAKLATEKENDESPAGIWARFSPAAIRFGAAWERVAHNDSPLFTKFLQVRSPVESYRRRETMGKDWQSWDNPFSDYLLPTLESWFHDSNDKALVMGAILGSMFGETPFGRIVGAGVGASVAFVGSTLTEIRDGLAGTTSIPQRREKERDLVEYMDALKFVKSTRVFEQAANRALSDEGFDVRSFLSRRDRAGDFHNRRVQTLQAAKREIYTSPKVDVSEWMGRLNLVGDEPVDEQALMHRINQELDTEQNRRWAVPAGPATTAALRSWQQARETMIAYRPGVPIADALAALPKKDREYLPWLLDTPREERGEMLNIAPRYLRRVLESLWGEPVEQAPGLIEFFENKPLPGADWEGWRPDVSLDDVKIKIVRREAMDAAALSVWPKDEERAMQSDVANVPSLFNFPVRNHANAIRGRLHELLSQAGLQDVEVLIGEDTQGMKVDVDIQRDRRRDFVDQLNRDGMSIFGGD